MSDPATEWSGLRPTVVDDRLLMALREGKLQEWVEARLGTPLNQEDLMSLLAPLAYVLDPESEAREEVFFAMERLEGWCSPHLRLAASSEEINWREGGVHDFNLSKAPLPLTDEGLKALRTQGEELLQEARELLQAREDPQA